MYIETGDSGIFWVTYIHVHWWFCQIPFREGLSMADLWVPNWIPNNCDGFLLRATCPSVVPRALNFDPL